MVTSTGGEKTAASIEISEGVRSSVSSVGRERGTTVTIKNLFQSVPARRKFLKLPQTEYRKIVETFFPIALIHPEIHFLFESEGKVVYNLPAVHSASSGALHPQRVKELLPNLEFIELFYDGEGIIVGGFAGHPRHQGPKVGTRYVFVNSRPIWDGGVARSVETGASRFISQGMKIPFLISLNMPYAQIDVNVHPRKQEVRFANPYRVFTAVESAVKRSFQDSLREELLEKEDESVSRLRRGGVVSSFGVSEENEQFMKTTSDGGHRFGRPSRQAVEESLSFSKMILNDSNEAREYDSSNGQSVLDQVPSGNVSESDALDYVSARQFLGRYIVAEAKGALMIVDQHAAAERIRYEKLLCDYAADGVESQALMLPVEFSVSDAEALFVEEIRDVIAAFGYTVLVQGSKISISSVPLVIATGNHEHIFREILQDLQ